MTGHRIDRAIQEYSHCVPGTNTHDVALRNEVTKTPAQHSIVSHGFARRWAVLDSKTLAKSREISESDVARPILVATSENCAPIDPDLQAVIERWPELPAAVKAGILAMVRVAM